MARANIEIIREVKLQFQNEWTLCFQWARYNYDNGAPSQMGYRFIYRKPDGSLQAAMGQARIPSAANLLKLLQLATEAGWFITAETDRSDLNTAIIEEDDETAQV